MRFLPFESSRTFPLLLCVVTSFVFLDCKRQRASGDSETGKVVHLTYWPAPNPQEILLADSVVTMWNRMHPDIQVRMQPIPVSQSTEEVLLAAIAGKTTPDVCSNIWPGAMREYTQAEGLVGLDTFSDFDSIAGLRVPRDLLATFKAVNGHYYQMPWKTNPVMMFYNRGMLKAAGVETVPRTYSEYFAAAKKVTRDINNDGQVDVWMGERDIRPIWWQRLFDVYPFYIAASNGKTLFMGDDVAFENRDAENVFSFFQECYARGYFPRTFFQGGDPFLMGKKATDFAGPNRISVITRLAPELHYGVAPLPVPDDHRGPVYTSGDYKNIAIFSTTLHPKEAWEFVKFLVEAEHDLLLLQIANQIPVRGDLLTNRLFAAYFSQNPSMVKFAEQTVYTRGMDTVPDLKEIFDAISQDYEACAVYGRKSPAEAVRDAAARSRSIIEWNQ
ncbi:MAG: multiple sugar transport system substrate-binding protein [Bacteroidetes bacterium]|nr:multiple sugar transport system substrate-binding protein [Bacteroidota bacterium]